jgi:hypothetical protein
VSGYQVNPAALRQTAAGIQDTIDELSTLGVTGSAEAGRGLSTLSLSGTQVGHQPLQAAFTQFLDRWTWGVRTLVQDGNQIAQLLNLNAGVYHDMEQYASGTFKDLTADLLGNPQQTDTQVEQRSWAQVRADNPRTDAEHPDTSAESLAQAGHHIAITWQGVAQDLASPPLRAEGTVVGPAPGRG